MKKDTPDYAYVIIVFIGLIALFVEFIAGYHPFPIDYLIYIFIYVSFGIIVGFIWPSGSWKLGIWLPFFFMIYIPLSLIFDEDEGIGTYLLYILPIAIVKVISGGIGSFLGFRIRSYKIVSESLIRLKSHFGPKKLRELLGERGLKILTLCSVLLALIPTINMVLWIYIFSLPLDYTEKQAEFYGLFPEFMRGWYVSPSFSAVISILAIILCSIGLQLTEILWKLLNWVIILICTILFLLNLFEMM